jgi:predicted amidohydrolase
MKQHDVTLRLPDAMLDALVALADEKSVSVGDLIREAVSRDLRIRGAIRAPGMMATTAHLFPVRPIAASMLRAD